MRALKSRLQAAGVLSLAILLTSTTAAAPKGRVGAHPSRLAPRFVAAACPPDVRPAGPDSTWMTCGYVRVPQDREHPSAKLAPIDLPVVVYRSPSATSPEPVVFIAGGPGDPAVSVVARSFLTTPVGQLLAREHVIIGFNQRGAGAASTGTAPDLGILAYRWRATRDESVKSLADSARLVAKRLRANGIQLQNFTTLQGIDDIADVTQALGYERMILFGVSYGTRTALQFMNKHPQSVVAAILDGVAPPSRIGLFDIGRIEDRRRLVASQLVDDCLQAPTCREEYSDLRQLTDSLGRADAPPLSLIVNMAENGGWTTLHVSGRDLLSAIGAYASGGSSRSALPQLLDDLARGDTLRRPLSPQFAMQVVYALAVSKAAGPHYPVVYHVIICGDDPGGVSQAGGRSVCDALGVKFDGPDAVVAVNSDIPTLLLSGEYDAQTPSEFAEEAKRTLGTSYHVRFPGIGHLAFNRPTSAPCVALVVHAFLAAPKFAPPTDCATAVVPAFLPRSSNP
jgi:pimeloyl-ACP methyl ester carboxylesterase